MAPHWIDQAWVLFGLREAVTADIRIEREQALADDAFDIMFHYPRSMRAVLRSSILAVAPRPRFVLHGTQGSLVKQDRKSTRLNSSHGYISYAVFCLKKKNNRTCDSAVLLNA